MAHVAAVLPQAVKAAAPQQVVASASSGAQHSFGDDFAQVLAGLAPKPEIKDAAPAVPHLVDVQAVAPAKPVAAKSVQRLPSIVVPAKADAKPDAKSKAPDAKAALIEAAPKEIAQESDEPKDAVAAIAAPQPLDSSKIAQVVRQLLAADTSTPSIDTPAVSTDTPTADVDAPKAAAPVAAHTDDDAAQPPQAHDAKPVTPEALAAIMATAKNTSAPSDKAIAPKAAAGSKPQLELPANVSVKVASVPQPDTVKAQPKPSDAPRAASKTAAPLPAATEKTARAMSDLTDAPQTPSKDSTGNDTDSTPQQSATPQRHDPPQAEQAPVSAKTVAAPQVAQAVVQAVAATPPANAAHSVAAATPAAQSAPQAAADAPSSLQNLGTAIAAKAAGGAKSFEIRLDPAELGRVEVKLAIGSDGKADATITVHRPETLALMLSDSHNLERSLRDAGLDVSNSSLNFSLKGDGRQDGGSGASAAPRRNPSNSVVARSEAANAAIANVNRASPNARLDIRV